MRPMPIFELDDDYAFDDYHARRRVAAVILAFAALCVVAAGAVIWGMG